MTPGPLAPARELYGVHAAGARHGERSAGRLRGDQGQGAEPLSRLRRRGHAAEKLGDKAKAKDNYQKLVALAAAADSDRPEVAAARKFLGEN